MWLRKVILVVIFVWGSANSKRPKGFKIQLKDGNFFFSEGNGDFPIDMMDKGPDICCIEGSGTQTKNSSNIARTLDLLDKTISDLDNDAENKKQIDHCNKKENTDELRKFVGESKVLEVASVDENGANESTKTIAHDIPSQGSNIKKETEEVKISDADLKKLRDVLDREYGKSILLIPKNDLESFIHLVKECSMNDMVGSSDTPELKSADERSRLPTVSYNPTSNIFSQPRAKTNYQNPEENHQEILKEFVRFLDKKTINESPLQGNSMQNGLTSLSDSNNQNLFSKSGLDTVNKDLIRQENNISLEAVKDFLDSLSEDKAQVKQSLTQWFRKNSENDNPRQVHTKIRRSLKNTTSSLSKRELKNRKHQQKATKATYQRISRCDLPILRKRLRNLSDQAELSWSSDLPHSDPHRFGDQRSLTNESNKTGENSSFGNEKWLNEDLSSEPRLTRAAFIR